MSWLPACWRRFIILRLGKKLFWMFWAPDAQNMATYTLISNSIKSCVLFRRFAVVTMPILKKRFSLPKLPTRKSSSMTNLSQLDASTRSREFGLDYGVIKARLSGRDLVFKDGKWRVGKCSWKYCLFYVSHPLVFQSKPACMHWGHMWKRICCKLVYTKITWKYNTITTFVSK